MEVDVIKLRERGKKLGKEVLKITDPIHGFMELSEWHLKNGHEDRIVVELVLKSAPNATCQPLARLVSPRLTKLKGDDMVYVGNETVAGVEYPQAWWCTLAKRPSSY